MNPQLRKQRERPAEIVLESRARLLHPIQRFGIAARFVQRVDDVEVSALRVWVVGDFVDEDFVDRYRVVSPFQSSVTGSQQSDRVARDWVWRSVSENRSIELLKDFDCFVELAFVVQTTGNLVGRVGDRSALRELIDERLVMRAR